MNFVYPQMRPTWHFMPFMPTYQWSPSLNLFQLQMQQMAALQYNAVLMQPGSGPLMMPPIPLPIHQLGQYHGPGTGPHQEQANQHRTAAFTTNQISHTTFSTISNDQCAISHHSQVGDVNNARNGLAGGPPPMGMPAPPNHKSRSHTPLQKKSRRASAIRSQRKCDDLLQYVVANEGAETGRPWKRRRRNNQLTANTPAAAMPPPSVAPN